MIEIKRWDGTGRNRRGRAMSDARTPDKEAPLERFEKHYCHCGCGEVARKGRRFVWGHNQRRPAMERFWEKVDKRGPDECWIWTAATRHGYGSMGFNGKMVYSHRWLYEQAVGPIPDGLDLDHLCRNRKCVNPAHLEPVTTRENILRGEGQCAKNARKTHCKRGHEFTPENTYWHASTGRRRCRVCRRETSRKWRAEH